MLEDISNHICLLSVSVHIPAAQSLKDKRMVIKSLKDKIRLKFNVSVAQLDTDDKWQYAILGIVMVGNDNRYIDGCMQSLVSFIESFPQLNICEHRLEFI